VAVWKKVTEMFSSQSKARIVYLHTELNQINQREIFSSGADYFDQITTLADEMATADKVQDDDIASYMLAGLDDQYSLHLGFKGIIHKSCNPKIPSSPRHISI
jgi:hypothetical protein